MNICPFKKFKNIFGLPNQGLHKYRFLNTPIIDYVFSIIGSFLLTYYTKIPADLTTIFVFSLGIISHILFGVNTNSIKYLGFNCK